MVCLEKILVSMIYSLLINLVFPLICAHGRSLKQSITFYEVFSCSMDKSKAFDLCRFSTLFRKMMRKISLVFVRLIIHMYVTQFSNVRWNNEISSSFTVSNGVGQGKILAGFAYCFYCFDFFEQLKSSGYGCKINGDYAGIFGYSDDDILLAPSITALQGMLNIAESFAHKHGLKFSTDPDPKKSKTKCISWLKTPRQLPKMKLCGNYLPWVNEILHLGNVITNDFNMMEADMKRKNARYVSKNIEINQEFYFASSETKMTINDIYNSSWYGSVLYDLFSPTAVKIESSYNRSMKIMLDLPYSTHRGLIEPISGRKHIKRTFIKRFIDFINKIRTSKKPILKTILSAIETDTRSITGSNLREILILAGKFDILDIIGEDSNLFEYFPRPSEDKWKGEFVKLMIEEREMGNLDKEDLELLNLFCVD